MNRNDKIILASVQALEKGLIPVSAGWDAEKAFALYSAMQARTKSSLPDGASADDVHELIGDILVSLEDAEPKYVPKWARPLLAAQ